MNTRGFPGNVRPEIPRVARGEQRRVGDLVDVLNPRLGESTRSLRSPRSRLAQVGRCSRRSSSHAARWRSTMLARTDGLPGPVIDEQVRKAGDTEPEVGPRAECPASRSGDAVACRGCRCCSNAPVIASKPVAKTMASRSYSSPAVRRPARRDLLDGIAAHVDQA